jgi:hypothetical protein
MGYWQDSLVQVGLARMGSLPPAVMEANSWEQVDQLDSRLDSAGTRPGIQAVEGMPPDWEDTLRPDWEDTLG